MAVAVTPPLRRRHPPVSTGSGRPGPSAGPSPSVAGVVVHVLGAVRKPGLVTLAAGSRVQDAIAAAGGLTGKADPGELNLAQAVTDGQQIVVGTKNKPAGEVRRRDRRWPPRWIRVGAGSGGGPAAGQPVDLNTASRPSWRSCPGSVR